MKKNIIADKASAYATVTLIAAEILLIIGSWIVSSVLPTMQIRSVLSGEGLRWLLGKTVANLTSPALVWITLLATSTGIFLRCGISKDIRQLHGKERITFQSRLGLTLVMAEAISIITIMFLLSAMPHAILLNVEGNLFPGSFSDSIVPVIAFAVTLCSTTYGITTARIKSATEWFGAICCGIGKAAPVFVLYILLAELCHTLGFILGS